VSPVLCFVSPPLVGQGAEDALVAQVAAAARAGVHLVQVRQPALEGAALLRLVRRAIDAVASTSARVIVNDRIDVALAGGAHGVHLRGDGPPAPRVRAVVPAGFLIGRSVHGAAEARAVWQRGALDYLVLGTVYPSASKPGAAACGSEALADAARSVPGPVLAIGGVTLERLADVRRAGAAGCAAIGLFGGDPAGLPSLVAAARRAFESERAGRT
jgi:thiamine-phosphate diphosphorylase